MNESPKKGQMYSNFKQMSQIFASLLIKLNHDFNKLQERSAKNKYLYYDVMFNLEE